MTHLALFLSYNLWSYVIVVDPIHKFILRNELAMSLASVRVLLSGNSVTDLESIPCYVIIDKIICLRGLALDTSSY